ncbi:hypothetical protein ALC60_07282 [Trachymyrmex zeteki]|uniref:F-box/LRR-repeat protein 12 n=1 Tax=Mycetomoellerius zeteki TaxID=64791 RepID=A0A151X0N2_9HYME|nr:hypothetical protein ALC60_07282 [Trachymyrmex zeteki]
MVNTLLDNDYPLNFIFSTVTLGRQMIFDGRERRMQHYFNPKYFIIPYFKNISAEFRTLTKKYNISLAHKPINSLIHITDFPCTIEKLSLEGCKMNYLQSNKSYFFKMDLHMPNLTCLILSNCEWFTPHSLLVISKIPKLKELRLNSCHRLGECVAYASLATRFGFKTLEILDLRDTALGDSEVGCFSSTKTLTHLYLECPSTWRNDESPEVIQHRQQQALRLPIFEDGNLAQFLVEDGFSFENYGFQRCLISDRAICALGSDTCDREVVNSFLAPQGMIILREDRRISNNPNLKTLVVRNYPRVTNSSLIHLALNASRLEYLDVTGTSVTRDGVESFKSQKTNVKVVSSFDET